VENKHRTGAEKAQGQLEHESSLLLNEARLLKENLRKNDIFDISKSESSTKAFKYTLPNNSVEVSSSQTAASLQWLQKISKKELITEANSLEHLAKSRKSYSSFKKRLNAHLKNSKKSKSIEKYFLENQYRELYNIILNLQSLPNFLLTLDGFKGYKACQIIAHEKGQAFATTSYCIDGEKTSTRRLPVEKFNKAFQTVKKSKSRLFSSQSFPENFSETIGSFMAKSFTGRKFNLILLLGRNDFLPPSEEELIVFDGVSQNLEPIFNAILLRSNKDDKLLNIMDLLEGLPIALSIKDKTDSYLFKNQAFEKLKEVEIKDFHQVDRSLTGKNTLSIFLDNSRSEETDLYHFYKVSLLGELLNTLRHELSNPLFGISLATDFLGSESEDQEVVETISDIKTNSLRCQQIIKNFSNLYEAEENFKDFGLINLVEETIILTKSETRGIQKTIEKLEDEIVIFSNPTWISQVLFNLIINAGQALQEKFGDDLRPASIRISIEANKTSVVISVSDNGTGVPEPAREKLFKPFFTTKEKGTGLGLSICKNLIKKLDGNMIYESSSEQGSKFSISLPFVSQ
jgi:two-component system NtrC family sensor kinase